MESGRKQLIEDKTLQIENNPQDYKSYFIRGMLLCSEGEYDKALSDFDMAMQLCPTNVHYRLVAGSYRMKLGRYDEAERDFDKAIGLDYGSTKAHRSKSILLSKLGRADEAEVEKQIAKSVLPDDIEWLADDALTEMNAGEWEWARYSAQKAVDLMQESGLGDADTLNNMIKAIEFCRLKEKMIIRK